MPGPLANVNTLVAGINADVSRLLYLQPTGTALLRLELCIPNQNVVGGIETIRTITKGWDILKGTEDAPRDGNRVTITVTDPDGTVEPDLRRKSLIAKITDGTTEDIFDVNHVPVLNPNATQKFKLQARMRNIRSNFDQTKRR